MLFIETRYFEDVWSYHYSFRPLLYFTQIAYAVWCLWEGQIVSIDITQPSWLSCSETKITLLIKDPSIIIVFRLAEGCAFVFRCLGKRPNSFIMQFIKRGPLCISTLCLLSLVVRISTIIARGCIWNYTCHKSLFLQSDTIHRGLYVVGKCDYFCCFLCMYVVMGALSNF